jgi:hypothetical protein
MWRIFPGATMLLGFPAWFVWWISYPNSFYLYAVMLYAAAAAGLLAWGVTSYCCEKE